MMASEGDACMDVRLDLLPEDTKDIFFIISANSTRDLAKFSSLEVTVKDVDSKEVFSTLGKFQGASQSNYMTYKHAESMIMCSICRFTDGLWRLSWLGAPCKGNLKDYNPVLNKLRTLGYPRNVSMQMQVRAVLEKMQTQLGLSRPPKTTQVKLDETSRITAQYTIEGFEGESAPEELIGLMQGPAFQRACEDSLMASGSDRFANTRIEFRTPEVQLLRNIRISMQWEFANQDRLSFLDHLDIACFVFESRALKEVIDYRGAHGVRIVHDGILDYSGVWVGPTGIGDATGGAVRFSGVDLDAIKREGNTDMEVFLDVLSPSITDLFFVLSSPAEKDMSKYHYLRTRVLNSDEPGHELASSLLKQPVRAEALVMCRLTRPASESGDRQSSWSFRPGRAGSHGTARDYQELIMLLHATQEQDYITSIREWPTADHSQAKAMKRGFSRNGSKGGAAEAPKAWEETPICRRRMALLMGRNPEDSVDEIMHKNTGKQKSKTLDFSNVKSLR
jgi:stress response protein SCP2